MARLRAFLKKHRLALAGLGAAAATALALFWAGYTVYHQPQDRCEYRIVHDGYVEKQGLYPADPAQGIYQTLPAGAGETLYGVRLMFVTDGRVAQGQYTVALERDGAVAASCTGAMTELLDGAFIDVLFDAPARLEAGGEYRLHITFAPATAEDRAGLVYGEGGQADPALPLSDPAAGPGPARTAALQYITNYASAAWALRLFLPLAALAAAAVLGGWWLLFVKKAKAHRAFAFLAAALGALFALVTPPLGGPDEYGHLAAAYSLASELTGQPGIGEGAGGTTLAMRGCDAGYMRDSTGPAGILAYKTMADGLAGFGNSPALTETVQVAAPAGVLPVQYLPQALAILLARGLGLGFFAMALLGRMASVLAYAALGSLAVRLAPTGKNIFFAAGLLPSFVSLAGTLSPDTLVNGLALVFTALCLQGYGEAARPLGAAKQGALLVTAALLGAMKAVYLPVLLLLVPMRAGALGGARRSRAFKLLAAAAAAALWMWTNGGTVAYMLRSVDTERAAAVLTALLAMAALAALAWRRWREKPWLRPAAAALAVLAALALAAGGAWVIANSGVELTPEEYAASIKPNGESVYLYSVGYILSHLPQTAKLVLNTLGSQLPVYLQGLVGALPGEPIVYGLELSWVLAIGFLAVLALASLRRADEPPRLAAGPRRAFALAALAVTGLCFLATLCWTPINLTTVFGMQGRYLLPVLPAALLLLGENGLACLRRPACGGIRFAAAALAAAAALQSLVLFAGAAYKP